MSHFTTKVWEDQTYSNSWTTYEVDLTAYKGSTVTIGFKYEGTYAHYWYVDDFSITAGVAQYNINVEANNAAWGTVTGGGWYMEGDTATLDAQPTNELYEFSHWDDSDTTNPRNIIVTQDTVFTANFIYHVGISDIDNTLKLTLSPNPAKTRLHIDCAQPVMNMSVIDANGRTVENISPSCQSFDIDVSRYTPGVYILSITTASGNASAKVVIGQQ